MHPQPVLFLHPSLSHIEFMVHSEFIWPHVELPESPERHDTVLVACATRALTLTLWRGVIGGLPPFPCLVPTIFSGTRSGPVIVESAADMAHDPGTHVPRVPLPSTSRQAVRHHM